MCASFWGVQPASVVKVNAWMCAPATDRDLESGPKHGKLYSRRAMSAEALLEPGTDAPKVLHICVWRERRLEPSKSWFPLSFHPK